MLYIMLKKFQIASQFSMLQKQHQMEQEQMDHLHFRTEETYVLQRKTESALTHIQDLLSNHKYPEAAAALDSFSQTFQKERFHPYCQDNLIQAILEGKKLRAEQYHIQVSYEIFLPDKLSIEITDLCSVFFNLMDNAIEACLQSGSQKPFIRLSTEFSGECLSIYLHNTKNPEQIFNHQTTKKESYNPLPSHGFGLSIIEDICQKYDGAYQWLDRTDYFDSIVLLKFL